MKGRGSQLRFKLTIGALLFLPVLCLAEGKIEPRPAPLDPVQAQKEARVLVHDILGQTPDKNTTNTGVVRIRDAEGKRKEIPVRFKVFSTPTNWISIYRAAATNGAGAQELVVTHAGQEPNRYQFAKDFTGGAPAKPETLQPSQMMTPFAGSDFWLADLGLEFFHWPNQRLLKKELRRGQSCAVLESVNPQPVPGGYNRVVSWIDIDPPHGIIHADA